ncbi:hypothetical protein E2C01_076253 [Portunus trituberculatus]|uniref:Uncharacterized protein n=2 Tax=Portunus trituberculatus TaxID=210409 RepID=A0A5B7IHD7_PORTR|nr:hypothetical protein [Portunus trituberculatus]
MGIAARKAKALGFTWPLPFQLLLLLMMTLYVTRTETATPVTTQAIDEVTGDEFLPLAGKQSSAVQEMDDVRIFNAFKTTTRTTVILKTSTVPLTCLSGSVTGVVCSGRRRKRRSHTVLRDVDG